jgi:hypothetical protein
MLSPASFPAAQRESFHLFFFIIEFYGAIRYSIDNFDRSVFWLSIGSVPCRVSNFIVLPLFWCMGFYAINTSSSFKKPFFFFLSLIGER